MRRAQLRSRNTGNVSADDAKVMGGIAEIADEQNRIQILSSVIPLTLLFSLILGGLWIDGNGSGPFYSLTSWREALSEANSVKVTCVSCDYFLYCCDCLWIRLLKDVSGSYLESCQGWD